MNKEILVTKFENWLAQNASYRILNSEAFAEYEIERLLKNDPDDGITLFENDVVFVGSYKYSYELNQSQCADGKPCSFSFEAIGMGCKENITDGDYELADYSDYAFIIR